jgi:hypothetical protein
MRTLSCVVGALTLVIGAFIGPVIGAFIGPVIGAEDHMMVTPNDLQWADIPSLPPGAKVASSRALWIK